LERAAGLIGCLGAAMAGVFYASIGGFQLTSISNSFNVWEVWLRGIGGLFFCYLGVRTFLSTPGSRGSRSNKAGFVVIFIAMFLLTLASPLTVFSFTTVFPGFGLDKVIRNNLSATELVIGVFIGSVLWWLVLAIIISLRRASVSNGVFRWVNRVSGVIIVVSGLVAILSLLPML
jgi:threonine/homoserine/homoserine lactone efflux protein